MPLDPKLARILRVQYAKGLASLHQYNIAQMRRYLVQPKLNTPPPVYQDILSQGGHVLRCFSPQNAPATLLPGVIYIPGSAYVTDRLQSNTQYCSFLANLLGMRVIFCSHRYPPEYKFPIFINDCLENIEWIGEHPEKFFIEPKKIALWGESSGANIAAVCAHVLREKGIAIAHQTLFYPMVDLATPYPSKEHFRKGYMLDDTFIQWLIEAIYPPQQDLTHPWVSPLLFRNFSHLPPTTLLSAEYDPLRDEGEAFVQKCLEAGIEVCFKRCKGLTHGFLVFLDKITASKKALVFASSALKKHFAKQAVL